MNINDLADKVLKQHVNRDGGAGELVTFLHTDLDTETPNVKCLPQVGDYRKISDDVIKDAMSFLALWLDIEPEKNDVIKYKGISWKIDSIRGHNPYDIVCYNKQNAISTRRFQ